MQPENAAGIGLFKVIKCSETRLFDLPLQKDIISHFILLFMRYKFEIRPKWRITLVGIEIVVLSIFIAMALGRKYDWDTYTILIAGIVNALLTFLLFFCLRFFRYVFSILFSLFWGYLAYRMALDMTDSKAACWITFGLVVMGSLVLHKDYFEFEK